MIAPVLWFTGLSGSGKTTIARAIERQLRNQEIEAVVLDGDDVRRQLSRDLGFSAKDRAENMRRISILAGEATQEGLIALVAAISPYREIRSEVRAHHPVFLEVFVDAPLHVCEQRDPKGLYARARAGAIQQFTGVSDVYEAPLSPDVQCRTDKETVEESCAKVLAALDTALKRASFSSADRERKAVASFR